MMLYLLFFPYISIYDWIKVNADKKNKILSLLQEDVNMFPSDCLILTPPPPPSNVKHVIMTTISGEITLPCYSLETALQSWRGV